MEPVLQPRYAMGMAMTLLTFAMLGRLTGMEFRHLSPSDLDPVKAWVVEGCPGVFVIDGKINPDLEADRHAEHFPT